MRKNVHWHESKSLEIKDATLSDGDYGSYLKGLEMGPEMTINQGRARGLYGGTESNAAYSILKYTTKIGLVID